MNDEVETKPKSGRKPLTLRRTEKGAVKQSFSHGRTNSMLISECMAGDYSCFNGSFISLDRCA